MKAPTVISLAKTGLAVVGLLVIVLGGATFVWPFIDSEGVVTSGNFREIEIDAPKAEVASIITGVSSTTSRLRMSGYVGRKGNYCPLIVNACDESSILKSDKWYLSYPGIYNERIELAFEGDRVTSIRYIRAPFDP